MLIVRFSATVAAFLFAVSLSAESTARAAASGGRYLVRVQSTSADNGSLKSTSQSLVSQITHAQNGSLIHRTVQPSDPSQRTVQSASATSSVPNSADSIATYALILSDEQRAALTNDPLVLSIENDDVVFLSDPVVPPAPKEISVAMITRALGLEDISGVDDSRVVVAVSDTGVDLTHPSLASRLFENMSERNGLPGYDDDQNGCADDINGCDLADRDGDPSPVPTSDGDHGTHTAGLIEQTSMSARLIVAKGFKSSDGTAQMSDLLRSVYYSVNAGAKVINCSWGIDRSPLQAERDAFAFALRSGALPVVAAGNSAKDASTTSPAGIDGVLTIGAINSVDDVSSFSNFGKSVSLFAPGGDSLALGGVADETLRSTIPVTHGSFGNMRGTSMAAPLVSGLAALVFAAQPLLTPAQVKSVLISTARKQTSHLPNGSVVEILIPDAFAAIALARLTLPLPLSVPGSKPITPATPASELPTPTAASPGCSLAKIQSTSGYSKSEATSDHQAGFDFSWVLFFVGPLVTSYGLRRRR